MIAMTDPDAMAGYIVTGANGWLGRRLVTALTRGIAGMAIEGLAGRQVRCLVPAGEDTALLERHGAEVVRGDIRDEAALEALFDGAQGWGVFHLAGVIHPRHPRDFVATNVQGTANVLEAAAMAQARRIVVMSSNSPFGANPSSEHRFDEASAYTPYMGYGNSKWQMELLLRAEMNRPARPEIVIARAPWFYGPGQPPRQSEFFAMIRQGRFPIVGPGTNRRSMSYVDSLAQGLALCMLVTDAAGEIYWLADAEAYSMLEIVDTVAAVLREDFGIAVSARRLQVPGLVSDAARIADAGLQKLGVYAQKVHVLSEMNLTIACSIDKARRELGYEPLVGLREGMRRSVEWCLNNGQEI